MAELVEAVLRNAAMTTGKKHQKLNPSAYGGGGIRGADSCYQVLQTYLLFMHISLFGFLNFDKNKNVWEKKHTTLFVSLLSGLI